MAVKAHAAVAAAIQVWLSPVCRYDVQDMQQMLNTKQDRHLTLAKQHSGQGHSRIRLMPAISGFVYSLIAVMRLWVGTFIS